MEQTSSVSSQVKRFRAPNSAAIGNIYVISEKFLFFAFAKPDKMLIDV